LPVDSTKKEVLCINCYECIDSKTIEQHSKFCKGAEFECSSEEDDTTNLDTHLPTSHGTKGGFIHDQTIPQLTARHEDMLTPSLDIDDAPIGSFGLPDETNLNINEKIYRLIKHINQKLA
jgi:hypothetical protein